MKLNIMDKNIRVYTFFFMFLIFFIAFSISNITYSNSENITIDSQSAILIDTKTGKILYEKNSNEKMYPASTTKILTAIITLENSNLNDVVTVSSYAASTLGPEYASANLQYGEQLTVEQLLQLLLVHSANDAAIVLAEHVAGSVDSFISIMNTKIYELGLTNTNFTNVYGGHDESHYTTASDLAKIMEYCIVNGDFRRIAGSASCSIPATNTSDVRQYESTNELIIPNSYNYYPYITAGKTGFTTPAGECLVSSAFKNDIELICVTLGGYTPSSRFTDTKKLFEYAYSNYSIQTIIETGSLITTTEISTSPINSQSLDLYSTNTISALLPNNTSVDSLEYSLDIRNNLSAPIKSGEILGSITYTIDNISYTSNLISAIEIQESLDFYYLIIGLVLLFIILTAIILIILLRRFFIKSDTISDSFKEFESDNQDSNN